MIFRLYAAARPDRPKGVRVSPSRWESSLRGREKEFKFGNEGSVGEELATEELV